MTQQSTDRYALVTGASRGLGKAIAIELSRRGYPTILVSRSDKVLEVCKEITSQYGLPSVGFMADLTDPRSIDSLAEQVNANYQVFMLINNAGVGGTRRFVEASTQYLESILDLNTKGTALLTHALLPNLLQQPQAYILNIGSMAAHTPTGFKTVYPASKAFIHHFSLGLREELKDTPVSVSVNRPHQTARLLRTFYPKISGKHCPKMRATDAAREAAYRHQPHQLRLVEDGAQCHQDAHLDTYRKKGVVSTHFRSASNAPLPKS